MHYYQFHIGDYRKDTAHLTPIEHYIYRSLIDWYYLDEKPIPSITNSVIRRLGLVIDYTVNVENVLADFFILHDDGYHHGRIDKELEHYHAVCIKNKDNGIKGGRPRKTHSVTTGNPDITQNNPDVTLTNNHKPLTTNHKPTIKPLSEYSADFEDAWGIYPKRSGANKKEAYKAWNARLNRGAILSEMKNGVARYAAYCKANKTEQNYIKLPSTFFGPAEHYLSDWKIIEAKMSKQDSMKRTGDLLTGRIRQDDTITIDVD